MNKWIDVNDRLPTSDKVMKYNVRTIEGSFQPKEGEGVVLGKLYPTGFRFITGDWFHVTHWRHYSNEI